MDVSVLFFICDVVQTYVYIFYFSSMNELQGQHNGYVLEEYEEDMWGGYFDDDLDLDESLNDENEYSHNTDIV